MSENSVFSNASFPDAQANFPLEYAPEYSLYDSTSIGLATFFGSPVAGTGLMALNYRRLGQPRKALLTFAVGLAATALVIAFGTRIPSYGTGAFAIALVVATKNAARFLQGDAIDQHIVRGGPLGSRWVASGLSIATAAAAFGAIFLFVFVRDSSSKVSIGSKDEVYFSGLATRNDAKNLRAALQAAGYFRDVGTSVILSKDANGTAVAFVVKDGVWDQSNMVSGFEEVVREIAPRIGGFPERMRLVNSDRQTMKEVEIGKLQMGTKDELYYYGSSAASDADAFGKSLKTLGFLQDRGASVFLSTDNGETVVSFVVTDGSWDDPTTVAAFQNIVRESAVSLGGLPLKLRLENAQMELKKELVVTN
jgi:hypothetical protein